MRDYFKNDFLKRFRIIANILFDTLIIITILFCLYAIDYIVKILGYENEIIGSMLHDYMHPILLFCISSISIINIFYDSLGSKDSNPRFELIYETSENDENE